MPQDSPLCRWAQRSLGLFVATAPFSEKKMTQASLHGPSLKEQIETTTQNFTQSCCCLQGPLHPLGGPYFKPYTKTGHTRLSWPHLICLGIVIHPLPAEWRRHNTCPRTNNKRRNVKPWPPSTALKGYTRGYDSTGFPMPGLLPVHLERLGGGC